MIKMTSVILDAVSFTEDVSIVARTGLTNMGFANSFAPRLLEENNYTRVLYHKSLSYSFLHIDYKTAEFAKFLSRTYIYAKELKLYNFSNLEKFLEHIKEDIPDMRLSSLNAIPFKYYLDFNTGCLKELNIIDCYELDSETSVVSGTTEKQIIIKNIPSVEMYLEYHKPQDFLLCGYFEHISFHTRRSGYLHNINKILSGVSFCKNLELDIISTEDPPYDMNFECVFKNLNIYAQGIGNNCISSMIFNEKLENLEIIIDDSDEVLCPDINYSNTKLYLITQKNEINLRISKLYENKHIRISVRGDANVLKISNAKGKTFEITTDGEVEFDEEPVKCIIKRC